MWIYTYMNKYLYRRMRVYVYIDIFIYVETFVDTCTYCIHAEKPACVDAHHTCLYTICIHTNMQTHDTYAQQDRWGSNYYNPTLLVSAYNTRRQDIDKVRALAWVYTRIYICIYIYIHSALITSREIGIVHELGYWKRDQVGIRQKQQRIRRIWTSSQQGL